MSAQGVVGDGIVKRPLLKMGMRNSQFTGPFSILHMQRHINLQVPKRERGKHVGWRIMAGDLGRTREEVVHVPFTVYHRD